MRQYFHKKIYFFFWVLLGLTSACNRIRIVEPHNKLSEREEAIYIKKNPMSYYEQSLPIVNSDAPEEGVRRLKKILTIHLNYPLALQALGSYYIKKKQYRNALHQYNILKRTDSNLFLRSYEDYAIALAGDGQFIAASEHMDNFIKNADPVEVAPELIAYYTGIKKNFDFAIEYNKYLKTFMTVKDLNIDNMGRAINSADMEYSPSMSVNAKRIIFTRRSLHGDEDLYEAFKNADGQFEQATAIKELNTDMNEGSASLSTDNKKMLVTYCDKPGGFGKCDIYISYYVEDKGWTPPKNLGDKINTSYWESQPQFGPNNNSIYFSSDKPGGIGGRDLWVAYLNEMDEWEEPINLGNDINTQKNEELPFMHHDNETLYFASDGWGGYGASDIFLAKRITDRHWEKPINVGFPINTIDKEGGMIVQFDATKAYFSSDKSDGNSQGLTDIYTYQLPLPFQPRPSTWVLGKVLNAITLQELKANVSITNLRTKRNIGNVITSRDGNFLITLPTGDEYSFNILKDGYLFYSAHLEIPEKGYETINKNFMLKPLEVGSFIQLNNVFFETNQATLNPKSHVELNVLVDLMNRNNHLSISIEGHTDNVGDEKHNLDLSRKRAKAVAAYLIVNGIASYRIKNEGFGSSMPIASNDSEEGRKQNRRSVVRVLSLR